MKLKIAIVAAVAALAAVAMTTTASAKPEKAARRRRSRPVAPTASSGTARSTSPTASTRPASTSARRSASTPTCWCARSSATTTSRVHPERPRARPRDRPRQDLERRQDLHVQDQAGRQVRPAAQPPDHLGGLQVRLRAHQGSEDGRRATPSTTTRSRASARRIAQHRRLQPHEADRRLPLPPRDARDGPDPARRSRAASPRPPSTAASSSPRART